jgi:hypothetical protein
MSIYFKYRKSRNNSLNPITRPSLFHSSKYGGNRPAPRKRVATTPTTISGHVTPLLYGIYHPKLDLHRRKEKGQ